jgi:hypothetical protein
MSKIALSTGAGNSVQRLRLGNGTCIEVSAAKISKLPEHD